LVFRTFGHESVPFFPVVNDLKIKEVFTARIRCLQISFWKDKKMKISVKLFGLWSLFLVLVLGVNVFSAGAHDFWIEVNDYTPKVGEDIALTLGYGHYLPSREFMPKDSLEEIYLLDENAKKTGFKQYSEVELKEEKPLNRDVTCLIVAKKKGGFFTKTTEGYQRGKTKKGLKNVLKCSYSEKFSKAVVNVGKGGGNIFSRVLGQEIELVPLENPGDLREGDYLNVKVLFKGKPMEHQMVYGTYMGFSTEKNVFAYTTSTDQQGIARIKMLKSGVWFLATKIKEAYPDPEVCDQYSLSATMTFEVP